MTTIVALATSSGRSAIGVLRLSGPEAKTIVRRLTDRDFDDHPGKAVLRRLRDPQTEEVLDHALVTYFKAPASFTGEDVVEISCHGSPVILRQLLDLTLHLGARLAEPGEFTLRALGNGKLNLSQAEAIRDLIEARTTVAAQQAVRQLQGELSNRLAPVQDRLLEIIVQLESSLEFAEDDLPALQFDRIKTDVDSLAVDLRRLADTYSVGHLLAEGIKVAIIGRPNVGKSSVFNALLGSDRAIVTALAGTTRDSISEQTSVDGVPVLLTDTAGLREADDQIESFGIDRTRRVIADADLLLVVLDGSDKLQSEDSEVLSLTERAKRLVVLNKIDHPKFRDPFANGHQVEASKLRVSAVAGTGIEELRAAILAPFAASATEDHGLLITNARHHDLLVRAVSGLAFSAKLLEQHASEELVLVGLHEALKLLGEITGETTTEDILGRIFATFCIGK